MKFLIALLVIVCLPLLKGQDFAMAHSQKQFFINHKSQRQTEPGIVGLQQSQFVQDFIIDDTDEDNDELKYQSKGYSLFHSLPELSKNRLLDFTGQINYTGNHHTILLSCYAKYIVAWALRV